MRDVYEEQLRQLNELLIEMGDLCKRSIAKVMEALKGDKNAPEEIYKLEESIDSKEREIESLCLKLILQQQPVAGDLRLISAALKMISDLERVGDQCSDITDNIRFLEKHQSMDLESAVDVEEMAKATMKMVTEAIDAFVKRDLKLAREVSKSDDVVDELFEKVKMELIELIEKNSGKGEACLDLLMIAKYFERIGDHATNVAEWVEFSITGHHPDEEENA